MNVTQTSKSQRLATDHFFASIPIGLKYEDLLIRPKLSNIISRSDVDISVEIVPGTILDIPIISSPMSTISEYKMCVKMHELGGLGILHRFAEPAYLLEQIQQIAEQIPKNKVAFSVGIREEDYDLLKVLAPYAGIVCVDVNIGHHVKTIEMVSYIRDEYPNLKVIAGSVSTFEGARDLTLAGAHCIRATNGGGSMCTTLPVTGVGLPTATSLSECVEGVEDVGVQGYNVTVIADGGHQHSGTMVIALGLGADAVMLGGLLAGTSACPSHAFFMDPDTHEYKAKYMGEASRAAQDRRGGLKPGTAPEGRSKTVPIGGKTRIIIEELTGGIRSGLSLAGSRNIRGLQGSAEFIRKR